MQGIPPSFYPNPNPNPNQAQYGLYCIAPSTLEADGIQLENIVCYRNRGYRKRDAKRGVCLENCLVTIATPHARSPVVATRPRPHPAALLMPATPMCVCAGGPALLLP